jgi:AcrR family transcriptional regulator
VTSDHPTSVALQRAAVALLDEHAVDAVTVEMVLARSGASKGSLYHHYRDFDALMDVAQVARFASVVDAAVGEVAEVLEGSSSRQEVLDGLVAVLVSPSGTAARSRRIHLLAQAGLRTSMRDLLGVEQQRLTDELADLLSAAQVVGRLRAELDPYAVAVLLQALAIGRAVDDVVPRPMADSAWESLLRRFLTDSLVGSATVPEPREPSRDRAPR